MSEQSESAMERAQEDATPSTLDKIGLFLTAVIMIPFGYVLVKLADLFRGGKDAR